MFLFILPIFLIPSLALSSVCHSEFEETVCLNFSFTPQTTLDAKADKIIIKNATGVIEKKHLSSLKPVTELTITRSEITRIEPEALCSVPNLTSITVTRNGKFPKITENLLTNCQNLKRIYLDGVQVENGAFTEFGDLHTLTLNATTLPDVLDNRTFQGLKSVKSLTIQNSNVHRINRDAFASLPNLKFLDLQANGIEEIEPETFKDFPELKVLNLGDNKLKMLSWDEFKDLKSLRVLFLERNRFSTVNVGKLVENLPSLERIFLSYDKLSSETRNEIDSTLSKHKINVIYSEIPEL